MKLDGHMVHAALKHALCKQWLFRQATVYALSTCIMHWMSTVASGRLLLQSAYTINQLLHVGPAVLQHREAHTSHCGTGESLGSDDASPCWPSHACMCLNFVQASLDEDDQYNVL